MDESNMRQSGSANGASSKPLPLQTSSSLLWAGLFALLLLYTLVVLVPFLRDGIVLMSNEEIIKSSAVIWTEDEVDTWMLWICLYGPVTCDIGI